MKSAVLRGWIRVCLTFSKYVSSQTDQEPLSTSQAVHRHATLASNGTSSWTVAPFGVLEATAMRPSS